MTYRKNVTYRCNRNPFVDQVYRFAGILHIKELLELLDRNPFVDQVYRFSLTPMICYFPMLDGLIRDLS